MPKVKFDRETILEKAFELAAAEGFENVSVRKVAGLLGSSTAPIYTAFGSRGELVQATKVKAMEKLLECTKAAYTDDLFLNIGVGMLVFARDYSNIYRELFINAPESDINMDSKERHLEQMKTGGMAEIFTEEEMRVILSKMWIFTHGFGTLICSGKMHDVSTDYFIKAQREVGSEIVFARIYKKGLLKEYEEVMTSRGEKFEDSNIEWHIW